MVYKNAFFLFLMQGINYVAPLVLIPFYTNTLGVTDYANIALWLAVIQFAYIITDFGFLSFATKEIAAMSFDKIGISRFVSTVYGLKLFVFFFVSLCVIFYGIATGASMLVVVISISTIFCQCYQPIWFFHGVERMKSVAVYFSTAKLLYVVLAITFVSSDTKWFLVLELWFFSQFIAFCISNYQYIEMGFKFNKPSLKEILLLFNRSIHFFISRLSIASYTSLNVIILGFGTSHSSLASFAICDQLFKAGQSFTSPITQSLYPYLQRTKDWYIYIKMTLSSLFILIIGLVFFNYSYEFLFSFVFDNLPDDVINLVPVFLCLILINFLARNFGNPLFGPINKLHVANNSVIIGAILHLGVVSILYLIGQLNAINLSYCVLFVEVIILFVRLFYLIKFRNLFKS
ncbi:hypothetical protein BCT91_19135 [Vibrio cyclitrophicus]|uniref:oligosaccharide flippase family protein n=1 Tax=Vibrio cyclitrophicus TaxID=47951 RepID=UPI000C849B5F|nr:oligosaccharide flippase family protein [Vibrio cyclitrophicus]PMK81657.1 hypothetical protein BCT91_19135 [Vibrio cyclitrophicus]